MKSSKLCTLLMGLFTALTLLSGSIALPILCRPFYYAHIGPLGLTAQTGLSEAEIRRAYDEMMDFCLGLGEFSTGSLAWSESGKSHFEDVRALFRLDLAVLALCALLTVLLPLLLRRRKLLPARPLGRGPAFWAGAGLLAVFLLLGTLAALDFERAFTLFHHIFFPGKSNWLFDWRLDAIILILPMEFFRNCALLILGTLVSGCTALICFDLCRKRSRT